MTDQKKINRLKLMLTHVERSLEMAEPDMIVVQKLLHDAFDLALEINGPPNPYEDMGLRPGLRRSSGDDVTNYEGKNDV